MTDFDVQALRQLADLPLPSDPVELARVWRHVGLDLVAAADEIERLQAALREISTGYRGVLFMKDTAVAALAEVPA